MYDNICKFIAEEFSIDIATWLLGEPVELVELSPKELSLEPIRTDSLILRQSREIVLHAEFQTDTDENMPFRMADYRLRVYRRYPRKRMIQVVIYLRKTGSELVYQDTFTLENTRHQFTVIRLWEQPTDVFLSSPGLFPFAVLSQEENKVEILQKVARKVDNLSERRVKANLSASAGILAGLVLKEQDIQRILRSDMMKESTLYQAILREGREEGREEGIEIVARNLLKIGMSFEQVMTVTGLSIEKLQEIRIDQE
jgi:predicted transposase/invertase (TIGR01784 family)